MEFNADFLKATIMKLYEFSINKLFFLQSLLSKRVYIPSTNVQTITKYVNTYIGSNILKLNTVLFVVTLGGKQYLDLWSVAYKISNNLATHNGTLAMHTTKAKKKEKSSTSAVNLLLPIRFTYRK